MKFHDPWHDGLAKALHHHVMNTGPCTLRFSFLLSACAHCSMSSQTVEPCPADVICRLQPLPHGNMSITAEGDPSLLQPATAAEERLYQQLREGREAGAAGEILVLHLILRANRNGGALGIARSRRCGYQLVLSFAKNFKRGGGLFL